MKKFRVYAAILSVCFLKATSAAAAGDYIDNLDTYLRGDFAAACAGFKELAGQGDAKAQIMLGDMYGKGECGPANAAEAVKWYTMAAEKGNAEARLKVALMHYDGKGVPQSFSEAARWYRLAADQGNAVAQSVLGMMYYDGKGVTQSDAEAVRLYRLAAEQRNALGMRLLGQMYSKGRGVRQDYVQAYMWLTLSFDHGDSVAADIRFVMLKKMTQDQIAEGKRLVKQWQPAKPGWSTGK